MRADLFSVAMTLGLLPASVLAETHIVEMLNRGDAGSMVFQPAFVKAQVGDVIEFVPTDRGHNVASVEDMLPEGVEAFESRMGQGYALTVTDEGLYGVECTPHTTMGMVALIQVGTPANLDAARAAAEDLRGKGKERMIEALALITP